MLTLEPPLSPCPYALFASELPLDPFIALPLPLLPYPDLKLEPFVPSSDGLLARKVAVPPGDLDSMFTIADRCSDLFCTVFVFNSFLRLALVAAFSDNRSRDDASLLLKVGLSCLPILNPSQLICQGEYIHSKGGADWLAYLVDDFRKVSDGSVHFVAGLPCRPLLVSLQILHSGGREEKGKQHDLSRVHFGQNSVRNREKTIPQKRKQYIDLDLSFHTWS